MIALLQRVARAHVEVNGQTVGEIGRGLLLLVCAEAADTEAIAERLLGKILKLRLFADDAGKMNRSLVEVNGGLLIVSQFTLAADVSKGNRPSFTSAAPAEIGVRLYERLVALAKARHPEVACGIFGADMQVHLINDGPVTVPLVVRD